MGLALAAVGQLNPTTRAVPELARHGLRDCPCTARGRALALGSSRRLSRRYLDFLGD